MEKKFNKNELIPKTTTEDDLTYSEEEELIKRKNNTIGSDDTFLDTNNLKKHYHKNSKECLFYFSYRLQDY